MRFMIDGLVYGWRTRRAWWFTASSRTRARFARTALGGFWLGLSNLLSIAALSLVYGTVFKVQDFTHYVVFLGTGLVIWNSIAAAIGTAPQLFEVNAGHLKNTNLHPIFYTLEEWAFQVQTFFQSFAMVLLGLSFFEHDLFAHFLISSWLPLLNLLLFLYWLPLVICILGARFRDLYQLIPIVIQLGFLLSPILYEKKNLGGFAWTADYNPVYRILSPLRQSLIQGEVHLLSNSFLLLVNIAGIFFGLWVLGKERKNLPFWV
jgi:lipopolysaccharide transport system permease protein